MFNRVTLVGRVRRPLHLQSVKNKDYVEFQLAVAKNGKTTGKRHVDYFECLAWNQAAKLLESKTNQGTLLLIDGYLTKNRTFQVVIEKFNILDGGDKELFLENRKFKIKGKDD